jgi:hypothetical protein
VATILDAAEGCSARHSLKIGIVQRPHKIEKLSSQPAQLGAMVFLTLNVLVPPLIAFTGLHRADTINDMLQHLFFGHADRRLNVYLKRLIGQQFKIDVQSLRLETTGLLILP